MNKEYLQLAAALVAGIVLFLLMFVAAMARFLKRPSPSEAIIRTGRKSNDVFIGQACWIVPVLHRASTMSLSTIGLTIRRASHDALVTKDYISTNLSAEFYIRVEPNEDDVKKAARTIDVGDGHTGTDTIRTKSQQLLEPKLIGALRAVAAQSDFLSLHLNREHFAQEVSNALREDLGRNGFTLESVTITELTQTPLSEMRADDIFGASGRETVTNTIVQKNIAVKKKVQEEAERTAEIAREQEINVAQQNRLMREGRAREEEAAIKAELAKSEAIETRDLQRQATIALEKAKKERAEQAAVIEKEKAIEAAVIDKEKTVEAATIEKQKVIESSLVDKQIQLTLKAKESAEADAKKAAAVALREKADQEVITVGKVAEAERQKRIAVVQSEKEAEQLKIAADIEAYKKQKEAEGFAAAKKADADAHALATRVSAEGDAEAVKIRAKAQADAAELQAMSITKLAEANREAGLKEAEVLREKISAANAKSKDILRQELVLSAIQNAPALVHEFVKPAERIGEIKVLQFGGGMPGSGAPGGSAPLNGLFGNALGPVAKTIFETSAIMPMLKEMMKFTDQEGLKELLTSVPAVKNLVVTPPGAAPSAASSPAGVPRPPSAAPPPPPRPAPDGGK